MTLEGSSLPGPSVFERRARCHGEGDWQSPGALRIPLDL